MRVKCKFCGKACANNMGLAQHIRFNHKQQKSKPNGALPLPSPTEAMLTLLNEEREEHLTKANQLAKAIDAVEQAFARD